MNWKMGQTLSHISSVTKEWISETRKHRNFDLRVFVAHYNNVIWETVSGEKKKKKKNTSQWHEDKSVAGFTFKDLSKLKALNKKSPLSFL